MFKQLFKRRRFLYSELPCKQRFLKILEAHVLPELEMEGFKLLKSGPSLKRVEEGFEWIVEFNASKWNSGNDVCQYNPFFTVRNKDYRKYLKSNAELTNGYGDMGQVSTTMGIHHWDKSVFSTDAKEAHFLEDVDFAKFDNYKLVEDLVKNIRQVGIPYFQMMSDFDGIKKFHLSQGLRKDAPKLIDLCNVLNRTEEIKSIIDWYKTTKKTLPIQLERQMEKRI